MDDVAARVLTAVQRCGRGSSCAIRAMTGRLGLSRGQQPERQQRDAAHSVVDVLDVAATVHRQDREVVRLRDPDDESDDEEQADAKERALSDRRRHARRHQQHEYSDPDVGEVCKRIDWKTQQRLVRVLYRPKKA
jgi:hypothetical protein